MPSIRYRPWDAGRWLLWLATALVLLVLPLLFSGGFAITLLSQMGVFVIFCLSYNIIFGQGGMLSFGHAVYSGLGAYFAIHALNWVSASESFLVSPWSVALLPLVGGVAGAFFGVIFGYLTTKTAGTPFAMITLGIGEMVHSASLMFPGFFGGEGGVSTNLVIGEPVAGITFGPGLQVYYLIAAWCFVCIAAMFALTHTPLGRIANAVRDNPERAEFIGYDTQRVRWLMLILSSFFAGIAGGLSAINFEIVSAESLSAVRSGGVLLATFIGGASFYFGPILGAIVFVLFAAALSEWTQAWQLYLGVFFVLLVMFAPGGLASLLLLNLRVVKFGKFARLRDPYVGVIGGALAIGAGATMLIEMTYQRSLNFAQGPVVRIAGYGFDTSRAESWTLALGTALLGLVIFDFARRRFKAIWDEIAVEIEDWLRENPEET